MEPQIILPRLVYIFAFVLKVNFPCDFRLLIRCFAVHTNMHSTYAKAVVIGRTVELLWMARYVLYCEMLFITMVILGDGVLS